MNKLIILIFIIVFSLAGCMYPGSIGATFSPGKIIETSGDIVITNGREFGDPFNKNLINDFCLNDAVIPTAEQYCEARGKFAFYKNTTEYSGWNKGYCKFFCFTEEELPEKTSNIPPDVITDGWAMASWNNERWWTNYDPAAFFMQNPDYKPINWYGVAAGLDAMNQGIYGAEPSGYIDLGYGSNSNAKGITKVCSYNCAGSAYSITIGAAEICPLSPPCDSNASVSNYDLSAGSTACSNTSEYIQGANKICSYDCVGSAHAITIGAAEICPITVNR